jgi:hypothetical protein
MDESSFISDAIVPNQGLQITAGGQMQVPNGGIKTALLETSTTTSNGVTTAKIANGAVITEKISDSAITTIKLANSTSSTTGVTTAKIADSNVTTAKLANASVVAEKLSGAQTGTAPVYGIRAYARVQGNGTVDINKGFSSISRGGNGFYNLTLTTAPSAGSVPAITATCHTESGNNYNLSATVQINSSTSFIVKTGHEDIPSLTDADFSIMVIY